MMTEKENNKRAAELFEYTKIILKQLKKELKITRKDKVYQIIIDQLFLKLNTLDLEIDEIRNMRNNIKSEDIATALNCRALQAYYERKEKTNYR